MEREIEAQSEYRSTASARGDVSGWAFGFIMFAALMMMLLGGFHMFAGLVAIFDDAFYQTPREYFTDFDASTWGWIQFGGGLIVLLTGFALLTGALWARILTVAIAFLSALVNFAFIPYYPVWSILMIALAIGVVWAVVAHGKDLEYS